MTDENGRTALYRPYDADDNFLYVGITVNPAARFAQHAADKPWWPQVARREVEWYGSRRSALAAEEAAIKRHSPGANRQHSPDYPSIAVTVYVSPNQFRSMDLLCRVLDVRKAGQWSAHDILLSMLLAREAEARGLSGDAPRYDIGIPWPDGIGVIAEPVSSDCSPASASSEGAILTS
jgi:predicted GIY-YIG superfamily endonuclease